MDTLTQGEAQMGSDLVFAPFTPVTGDISMKTDQLCPNCAGTIVFTQEVVELKIVQARRENGQMVRYDVFGEDGDYLYEPYYICFSPCWEDIEQWLGEEIESEPPIEDAWSQFQCRYCQSGIREWELCGSLVMGEFHVSPRSPNGHMEETFVPAGEADLVCLYCLYVMNDGNIELWDQEYGGITEQNGECGDCLQARCWRSYPIQENGVQTGAWTTLGCDCACHLEEMKDE